MHYDYAWVIIARGDKEGQSYESKRLLVQIKDFSIIMIAWERALS